MPKIHLFMREAMRLEDGMPLISKFKGTKKKEVRFKISNLNLEYDQFQKYMRIGTQKE